MSACIPNPQLTCIPAARGRIAGNLNGLSEGVFRLPTDPIYFFTLTLINIVVGSRYRVTRHDTGAELATGVAATTSEVITGVSAYNEPMLMDITIRLASGPPNYKIFDTSAYSTRLGTSVYVLQLLDE